MITFRAEIIGPGIQKNIYKLKDHEVWFFDIEVNSQPLEAVECMGVISHLNFVPILNQASQTLGEWLNGRTIKDASTGESKLREGQLREGIVIKPLKEQHIQGFGRLIIKMRSLEYLAKSRL